MKKIIAVILMSLVFFSSSVFAQKDLPSPPPPFFNWDDFYSAPIIPMEILISDRQSVTDHLVRQIEGVFLKYVGRSVIGSNEQYISRGELESLGYIHKGSFTEFSDAIAKIEFSRQVVKTPEGYYDVRLEIKAHGPDGRTVLKGNGYLDITVGKGGGLTAREVQPYVWIPENLIFQKKGYITGAMWMAEGHNDEDVAYQQDFESPISSLFVPTRMLGNGHLVIADLSGEISGWDLLNKTPIVGQKLIAMLGKSRSTDVLSLKNPSTLSIDWATKDIRFYRSNGKIYGRFPLLDISTDTGLKEAFFPTVKIWGTDEVVPAWDIIQKLLWVNDPKRFDPPTMSHLPFLPNVGGWTINVPPGGYHIEVKFKDVFDWEMDPNPKG